MEPPQFSTERHPAGEARGPGLAPPGPLSSTRPRGAPSTDGRLGQATRQPSWTGLGAPRSGTPQASRPRTRGGQKAWARASPMPWSPHTPAPAQQAWLPSPFPRTQARPTPPVSHLPGPCRDQCGDPASCQSYLPVPIHPWGALHSSEARQSQADTSSCKSRIRGATLELRCRARLWVTLGEGPVVPEVSCGPPAESLPLKPCDLSPPGDTWGDPRACAEPGGWGRHSWGADSRGDSPGTSARFVCQLRLPSTSTDQAAWTATSCPVLEAKSQVLVLAAKVPPGSP